MTLLPEELKDRLPPLDSSGDASLRDLTVHARFFDPVSQWKWYALEFDGSDTFYGLIVTPQHAAAGQFTLRELEALSSEEDDPGVARDESFEPKTVQQLIADEPNVAQIFAGSGLGLIGLDE